MGRLQHACHSHGSDSLTAESAMSNPYQSPQIKSDIPQWPKRWAFTLTLVFLFSACGGGLVGYWLGYQDGYILGNEDRVADYPINQKK